MKFALLPLAALTCTAAFAAEAPKIFTGLIPADTPIKGEIVVVVPPPELDKYIAKVEQAARKDPNWFKEHAKNGKPGVPLPYDERLGLTKEEYDDYLKTWSKREFKPVEPVAIQLKGDKEGRWTINMTGGAQNISTLKYDAKEDVFKSPNGTLKRIEDVSADADSTLGAWSGSEWKFEEQGSFGTTKENIAVGKTADKKYGLVVYRFQEVSGQGTRLADRGMVVRFPLGSAGIIQPKGAPAPKVKPAPAPTKKKK